MRNSESSARRVCATSPRIAGTRRRTALSQGEAEQRVDRVMTRAKAAADESRSAAAKIALRMAATLLRRARCSTFAASDADASATKKRWAGGM